MKKGHLLNSEISHEISKMGHTDGLVIADSGLPIPTEVKRIDLALTKNIPNFLDVLGTICKELFVEEVVIAKQMKTVSPQLFSELMRRLEELEKEQKNSIAIKEVDHEDFKEQTKATKCIVRTGECTPYANIILKSGVDF